MCYTPAFYQVLTNLHTARNNVTQDSKLPAMAKTKVEQIFFSEFNTTLNPLYGRFLRSRFGGKSCHNLPEGNSRFRYLSSSLHVRYNIYRHANSLLTSFYQLRYESF